MKKQQRERQPKFRAPSGGSAKPSLTFYRSAKPNTAEQSPFKKKELPGRVGKVRKFLVGFLDILIVISFLLLLIYSLIIRPSAHVESSSQKFHQNSVYQDAVNKILKGIKNSNKITFNEESVVKELQNQFPEISGARVELPIFSQTPVVHLKIANPSFVLTSNEQSYIVDSDGVAVARSQDYPSIKNLVTVQDQSGFPASVGKQVMSADSVKFVNTVSRQVKNANIPIASMTLPSKAQELELRTTDRPYFVKFYLGGDRLQQIGQFLATRHQFDQDGSQPEQYLDVRVAGKIFYK